MTNEQLLKLARPTAALSDGERSLLPLYLELFETALRRLSGDGEPTAEQVILARRRASVWLEVDRQSNTAQAVAARAAVATSSVRRDEAKADAMARRDHLASAVAELRILRRFESEALAVEPLPSNVRFMRGVG